MFLIAIVLFSFPDYFEATYNGFTVIDAVIIVITIHFCCCGAYLWLKGFTTFNEKLENPGVKLLYISLSIFAAYFFYYRNMDKLSENS